MRFTRIIAMFIALAVPFAASAQQAKSPTPNSQTMEGTVIGTDGTKYWRGFKIDSGGKEFRIVTKFNANQGTNPTIVGGKCCEIGTRIIITLVGSLTGYLLNVTRVEIVNPAADGTLLPSGGSVKLVPIPARTSTSLRQQVARQMTPEESFFYQIALYGHVMADTRGKFYDNVDAYGKTFDDVNYKRAMADEFERGRYRERIQAKIDGEVKKVDFNRRFTSITNTTIREYSFESHSFPLVRNGVSGVNENQFNWILPMSETDANSFVKIRSMSNPGSVDRRIILRVTYSLVNQKTPEGGFFSFLHSIEAFSDESLTWKLGVIPKLNLPGPRNAEEWRLAYVASLTATKEIGKYRYMPYDRGDGKIHDPLKPRPDSYGTITLTDVGITMSEERKGVFNFYDWHTSLSRYNLSYNSWDAGRGDFHIGFADNIGFKTQQERDRFFVDLAGALQEWKAKYDSFQFAAGKLIIKWACTSGPNDVPCADSKPFGEKPVWKTPTYLVTVESLKKNSNNYIAILVFENITDKKINIGWQEKSSLLPNAVGPYLIDDEGQKYFAEGTDSGKIISDGMTWLWTSHDGIPPKSKLKSRFVFSGSGNGKVFTLKAKTNDWPRGESVVIEGLKVATDESFNASEKVVTTSDSGNTPGSQTVSPDTRMLLVGTWRDENSLITYRADGTKTARFDSGVTASGTWAIDGNNLTYVFVEVNGKRLATPQNQRYQILEITKDRYVAEGTDGKVWNGVRVR